MSSFEIGIINIIDIVLDRFIYNVSQHYCIDYNELRSKGHCPLPPPLLVSKKNSKNDSLNNSKTTEKDLKKGVVGGISSYTVEVLKLKCKELNLKTTGGKKDLIERLEKSCHKISTKISLNVNQEMITKNSNDRFEHTPTSFIFDPKQDRVIGKQNNSGMLDSLTKDDIYLCKEYGFLYKIPENLNYNEFIPQKEVLKIEEDEDEEEDDCDFLD